MHRIVRWWRKRKLRKLYQQAQRLVGQIDNSLKLLGYSRAKRKGLWRDFLKNDEIRGSFFNKFLEDLDGKPI